MNAQRLSVQQTTSRVLLEAGTLEEAMAEILRALSVQLDWPLAIYWVAAGERGRTVLECRAIWAADDIAQHDLVEASRVSVLRAGEDPAGRALAAG